MSHSLHNQPQLKELWLIWQWQTWAIEAILTAPVDSTYGDRTVPVK
ncbi:MAG: hypothetical protein HC800_03360 [Phormidesmis sp. RL_2_1]|nr:hypothetical protein [Phormidesmis sp. RL_2_1]